jgi:hypothetical protein
VLVEQAGDVRSFLDSKQMRPIVFFAEKPQVGYEDIPLASKYGVTFAISQFRSVVMRAGTDPAHVKALAAAMDKCAQSDDFKKYLSDELAFADSYIRATRRGPSSPSSWRSSRRTCRRSPEAAPMPSKLRQVLPHGVMLAASIVLYRSRPASTWTPAGASARRSGPRRSSSSWACCAPTRS